MKSYSVFLPSYSVGTDCYKEIPFVTKQYGNKAVVIGGKTAMEKSKDAILEGIKDSNVSILDFIWYGGNSTYENVEMLMENNLVKEADMVFAVGGGRAVDTCKVVCDKLNKPIFTFPTVASNCAACTAISVIYNMDGTFCEYYYIDSPANHTFINTKIIAESPDAMFWAGIGDALSKEFEVLLATREEDLFHTTIMGSQLSRACTDPLIKFGEKALRDCRENRPSYELQEVALDIIITTGIVSNMTSGGEEYYYNSSLAHAFYYGSTVIPRCENHLHGEIVSFGVLCLLTYDKQFEERETICKFNKSMGLPICLEDLDITKDDVLSVVEKAATVTEWHCTPYEMSKEKFIKAILECNDYGMRVKYE